MEAGQLWRQYIIAGIANFGIACIGYCMGWTSPVNMMLEEPAASPLPETPTTDELAWIGSLITIGAIFGPFIAGFLSAGIGRKWCLLSTGAPLFVGWILVTLATNVAMIYAGRVFWGLSLGMLFTVCPMYSAEIATVDCRGALGSFLKIFIGIGYLLVYVVGPYVSYYVVSYVGIACVAVFCVTFYFMPESPIYYLSKSDRSSAAESLTVLRGRSLTGVQEELDKMAEEVAISMKRTAKFMDLFRGSNLKAFYISCVLVMSQQACGISVVLFYLTPIFHASGIDMDAAIATIIIGVVQVVASLLTPFIVDRLGRKILLLTSSFGTALGQCLLGLYFILDDNDSPVVSSLGFLPVLSLVLFMVAFCWGLGPLPFAVMSEILPIELKAIATPIATAFCWITGFLVSRYFNPIAEAAGMGVAFFMFGGFCLVSFVFTLFLVPETKGKSFQEIQELLAVKSVSQQSKESLSKTEMGKT